MRLFSSPAWLLAAMPFFVIVLLLSGSVEAARADRYFVDYEGNTGYYVDVNSIELPSDHEVELDLYLVKLHSRYMYRYRAYFDTAAGSYEYRNTGSILQFGYSDIVPIALDSVGSNHIARHLRECLL